MSRWYKLDTAAKLFSTVGSSKRAFVYRLSVLLNEKIDSAVLGQAAEQVSVRFPMLFMRMHNGVFWRYIDENESRFSVLEDTTYPCSAINPRENNGYMIRVLYYHKRISVECSHILTDGGGALEFMKSLVFCYLQLLGKEMNDEGLLITFGEGASLDEQEDSYYKYSYQKTADSNSPEKIKTRNAFRIRGTELQPKGNHITTGIVSAKALNTLAKTYDATITSYLAAVLVYSIIKAQPVNNRDKRPIVITVPVNLRKAFPSETLRNFSSCVNLCYEQKESNELPDIIAKMTADLRQKTDKENLRCDIIHNSAIEKNIASRFVPLLLKRFFISLGFSLFSEKKKTMTLSNLGNIRIPSDLSKEINRFEAFSYASKRNPMFCAVCSAQDSLAISFTRSIAEPNIIRNFFCLLSGEGTLDVKVYSNEWGNK
ncbi:MAG: alcohol acetyltransferase [Ruminococcus sp.]|jgi:NRPS condensation-like uncharacterized protein|nr:alcohol acetyltransferase [Ruminococcus sp.]